MAPMFTSSDLPALISAFPPQNPTRGQPSLVRSRSGNSLLNSQKVLTRFQNLLETEKSRIRDLSSQLNAKDVNWIFDCYDGPICFGLTEQEIVTKPELEAIWETLRSRAKQEFVDVSAFASSVNVSVQTFTMANLEQANLQSFTDPASKSVIVGSSDLVLNTRHEIETAIANAGSEKVNLSNKSPGVPSVVLSTLAAELKHQTGIEEGEVETFGNEIFFVPSTFIAAQSGNQKQAFDATVAILVQQIEQDGFCVTSDHESDVEEMAAAVSTAFRTRNPNLDIRTMLSITGEATDTLVREDALQSVLEKMEADVATIVEDGSLTVGGHLDADLERSLIGKSSNAKLASLLLESESRKNVENKVAKALGARNRKEKEQFDQTFQIVVMAPAHLYSAALAEDSTLRQHQEEYIGEHFRTEVIPQYVESMKQRAMTGDKSRNRDMEKMVQACKDGKTLSDVQSAISRFAKRQKIEAPTADQLEQVKKETLQQKIKVMHKMSRGSDVLQNLLWIALAQKSDGLFMSSGKDTSRMIKQYQLVGDAETATKLEEWKDLLKSGKESRADIQEMREMAMRIVEEMYA